MSELARRIRHRYYPHSSHPYRQFEAAVSAAFPSGGVILDAGCGREAPVLRSLPIDASRRIGVDLVDFRDQIPGVELINSDLGSIPVPSGSVDLIMSRSVFEHLAQPEIVYGEMFRILKPGGCLFFLTANAWDYATVIARLVPNRFHARIVAFTEGRAEEDVFPTVYRSNTRGAVRRLAAQSGFAINEFVYLGQYPNYLLFNGFLFFLGTCYDKLICRFDALKFLRGWIMVTLRKPG